jgi:hypothetical protein
MMMAVVIYFLVAPHVGIPPAERRRSRLGRDADPFMLYLYAVLAEKERRLISERTKRRGGKEIGGS